MGELILLKPRCKKALSLLLKPVSFRSTVWVRNFKKSLFIHYITQLYHKIHLASPLQVGRVLLYYFVTYLNIIIIKTKLNITVSNTVVGL